MNLKPGDLGLYWQVRLVQARDNPANLGADVPAPRSGWLTRWYGEGAHLSEREAATLVPASKTTLTGNMAGFASVTATLLMLGGVIAAEVLRVDNPAVILSVLTWGGLLGCTAGASGARHFFARLIQRPLGEEEVSRLLEKTSDPLHRQYLELVRDVVRQPVPPGSEANLREALRSLAETINTLPPLEHRPLDLDALRAEAATLMAEAAGQADRITAESIERRARAILYRIEAHERTVLLAQRNQALRAEVEAQMHALREGLVALQAPSADAYEFAALAAAARQVATEAGNMASARQELEACAAEWPIAPSPREEPVTLQQT